MSKTTFRERVATRAYYLALNGHPGGPLDHWLHAEAIEIALSERRSEAARKGAATRRIKALPPLDRTIGEILKASH